MCNVSRSNDRFFQFVASHSLFSYQDFVEQTVVKLEQLEKYELLQS